MRVPPSKLMSNWPLQTKCAPKEKRKRQVPLFVAFVRHPYSRLVSGFHTVMSFVADCKPGSRKWTDHGERCAMLRAMPWWQAYEATKEPGRTPSLASLSTREVSGAGLLTSCTTRTRV